MYVAKAALQRLIVKLLYSYYQRPDANTKDYVMLQNVYWYLRRNMYPYLSMEPGVSVAI